MALSTYYLSCVFRGCEAIISCYFYFTILLVRCSVAKKNLEENGVTDFRAEDVLDKIINTPTSSRTSSRTKVRQAFMFNQHLIHRTFDRYDK